MSALRPPAPSTAMVPPRDSSGPSAAQPSASQVASTTALTHPLPADGRSVYQCLPPVADPTSSLPISPFRQQVLQHEQLLATNAVPSNQDRVTMMEMAAALLEQRMHNVRRFFVAFCFYVCFNVHTGARAALDASRGHQHARHGAAAAL